MTDKEKIIDEALEALTIMGAINGDVKSKDVQDMANRLFDRALEAGKKAEREEWLEDGEFTPQAKADFMRIAKEMQRLKSLSLDAQKKISERGNENERRT